MKDAVVQLWGTDIGSVSWVEDRQVGVFQYEPSFLRSHIQVAPLMMPLRELPYEFPALARESFHGLPGLLADSLPDKFGNAVIDAWLASRNIRPEDFHPVERLGFIDSRGMGALEFKPALRGSPTRDEELNLATLVDFSNRVLAERANLKVELKGEDDRKAMQDILRVGTSAGGARAKAVVAWNRETNQFRSGQVSTPAGFEHWIIKFDGVSNNRDKELATPLGFGKVEFAYSLMAARAGIHMTECRLIPEGGRSHFMTRRFDRDNTGGKIHMQSLGAMAHADYNQPALYSYEQAIQVMKRLSLPREDLEQFVTRAIFNVAARNQDDHVKNIAFLMDRRGDWRVSPAFDVTYAYDPHGAWTGQHQMSIQGKRDGFLREDLIQLASLAGMKPRRAAALLDQVLAAVASWPEFAAAAGVEEDRIRQIASTHRLYLAA